MDKIKLKIELIMRKIDIIKSKLLLFSAGVAGCWSFLSANYSRLDFLVIISLILIFVFGIGVSMNVFRLNDMLFELNKLERELNE